ncbi:MAG: iron-containing alcohol dehydrogenase [Thiolinea sp.]
MEARQCVVDTLREWGRKLQLPTLGDYGVDTADIEQLVAHSRGSSMKTNPVLLTDAEIAGVIRASL